MVKLEHEGPICHTFWRALGDVGSVAQRRRLYREMVLGRVLTLQRHLKGGTMTRA